MRPHWLLLSLVLVSGAHAAPRTVEIPLKHFPATELQRILLLPAGQPDTAKPKRLADLEVHAGGLGHGGGLGGASVRGLLPPGIAALTVNPQRNSLTVSGEAEPIEQLVNIIRLLDIPPRQMKLSLRRLAVPAAELQPLPNRARLHSEGERGFNAADAPPDARRELEKRTALESFSFTVVNNYPVYLRPGLFRGVPAEKAPYDSILPRINGDGTITLIGSFGGGPGAAGQVAARPAMVLRRVSSGHSLVVWSEDEPGTALLVTVEILPEPAPPAFVPK